MAVAFTSSSGQALLALATSKTYSYDVGASSNRAVAVSTKDGNVSMSSVSYAGTDLGAAKASTGGLKAWGDKTSASGANNVVVTYSAYGSGMGTEAVGWNGVDQTTPFGTGFTNTGNDAAPTATSQTCPSSGALYASMHSAYQVNTTAPSISGAGNTLTSANGNIDGQHNKCAGGYRLSDGAVAWTTVASSAWEVVGLPINASGGAATPWALRFARMIGPGVQAS